MLLPRYGVINKKEKYTGGSNLSNSVINVSDITLPVYQYRKKQPHGSYQVNGMKIGEFNIVYSRVTNCMGFIYMLVNSL
jgi:hypothetical protein